MLFFKVARAEDLKVTTWNLDWLTARADADLPSDVHLRAPEDFVRLAGYVRKLNADIIGFQEVDGPQAAAMVFGAETYDVVTIDETVLQRVGLAVRHGIRIVRHPDIAAFDVTPAAEHKLRDGLDATLVLAGGQSVRVLVVHLKTGCQTDVLAQSRRPQCAQMALQIPVLAAWVAARRVEGVAFLVLGDFNRVLDAPEEMSAALEAAAPLRRATEGRENPCWDGAPFIDHIFAGGPARDWLEPETLRVQVFREVGAGWKKRLSDHCPVSVKLRIPG